MILLGGCADLGWLKAERGPGFASCQLSIVIAIQEGPVGAFIHFGILHAPIAETSISPGHVLPVILAAEMLIAP